MKTSKIIGTGSSLPKTAATNNYLATFLDTSDEWIRERTGIEERRLASTEQETAEILAIEASKHALESANIPPEAIDLIVFATFSADSIMPNAACVVQRGIQAEHALCFDLNAACTGFLYAMQTAHAYLVSGMANYALVIGAENVSKTLDWSDRSTCVLFGDGAGACIMTSTDFVQDSEMSGILGFESGSDGKKGDVLSLKNRALSNPYHSSNSSEAFVHMDGQEVYRFAVRKVPEMILALTAKFDLTPNDIDLFLLHQANKRILSAVAKRLKVEEKHFPLNLNLYGNTSAASVPILLDELNRSGTLHRKDRLILSGFGAGLTWSSALLFW